MSVLRAEQNWVNLENKRVPLVYEDTKLECGYRVDLIVENKVICEIKSVECLSPVSFHSALVSKTIKLQTRYLPQL